MTTYYKDSLTGDLKATRYAPEMYERKTLEVDGVVFTADVVPCQVAYSGCPGVGFRLIRNPNTSFGPAVWQRTDFGGEDVDFLSVKHPVYGVIDKTMIGQPFLLKENGKKMKKSKFDWRLKSISANGAVIEASIGKGLFKRKIYKFI